MVDLESYVTQKLSEGYREEAIKRVLVNNKYSPSVVDQALAKCRNKVQTQKVDKFYSTIRHPTSELRKRSVAISIVFAILVIFFQLLNYFYSDNQIVLGLSSLVILGAIIYLIYWLIVTSIELKEEVESTPSPYLLLLLLIPIVLGFVDFAYSDLLVPMMFLSVVIVYLLLLIFNNDVKSVLQINTDKNSTLINTVLIIIASLILTPFAITIYIQNKINKAAEVNLD